MMSISRFVCTLFKLFARILVRLCTERIMVIMCFSVGSGMGPETFAPERFVASTIFVAD